MAQQLSAAQCVLLTVHLASEANIAALHAFTPSRLDALDPELVLRIILTFLPETVDPPLYTTYIGEVASRIYLEQRDAIDVDTAPVRDVSDEQAQRRVKKLNLVALSPPVFPPDAPQDLLTRFLCHRAYRIDAQTGLLTLVPALVSPFLDQSDYLRTWFVSLVLPLLRLGYDYYPAHETPSPIALEAFEKADGPEAIRLLLANAAAHASHPTPEPASSADSDAVVARDLRGLVGPWVYGHSDRKRRRVVAMKASRAPSQSQSQSHPQSPTHSGFIHLDGVGEKDKTDSEWEYAYQWLVAEAAENFSLVVNAVEEWDGPGDIDLGGYAPVQSYLDDDTQQKLERQYAQAAFAACYTVTADTSDTINGAHGILCRLAQLLDFEPPPELATTVQQLPHLDRHAELLHATESTVFLEPHVLLKPDHPLTTPKIETYMLLQMLVYSAYQLAGLGHSISILHVAELRFFSSEEEQLALLQKLLHGLSTRGKRDEQQWLFDYNKLIWLWNWNIESDDKDVRGAGIFGKIDKATIEKELLKVLVASGSYGLIDDLYFSEERLPSRQISSEDIHQVLLEQAMQWYDSASNGNRTRGNMKKASDLINHAKQRFPDSEAFRRASALLSATHSLSFYSLKLQHGVPFQPVNIRASSDPLSLLPKVLEQNTHSYTKLDDIVNIGRNLVAAGLPLQTADGEPIVEHNTNDSSTTAAKIQYAERRAIAMCVEAALSEDDFETAYSYIVNRLAPPDGGSSSSATATEPSPETNNNTEDDASWRAAFLAGRYRPRDHAAPTLRRLEQRTELLSLALLLAPPAHLSEILGVWRRCEEETTSLLATETAAEQSFDDRADRRRDVPGGFEDSSTEGMVFGQQRREVGRMATGRASSRVDEEAPMGLFDVARGAAKAFSRNAFPLRGAATAPPATTNADSAMVDSTDSLQSGSYGTEGHYRTGSSGSAEGRMRRRDVVANAVTGGLASGIGWVLGATPVDK